MFQKHLFSMSNKTKVSKASVIGFSASILCAIHCMAMPFILSFGVLGGMNFGSGLEFGMIGISIIFGIWSIGTGYKKHGNRLVVALFVTGALLLSTYFLFAHSILVHTFNTLGGLMVAASFFWNFRIIQS